MIIKIVAKGAPHETVKKLLEAARAAQPRQGRHIQPPQLSEKWKDGCYYAVVGDPAMAGFFQASLTKLLITHEEVTSLPRSSSRVDELYDELIEALRRSRPFG